jgi:hypothetical protein
LRNFIFEDFLEIVNIVKCRKNEDGMIAGKSKTKYAAALRYSNHVTNKGNKNDESKNE